jgi:uncharacterized Tic20 family protein
MENKSSIINNDERLIALFSHLSIFFGGIILPLIFWLTNKDKSKFITFHSLQTLWFHLLFIVMIIVFVIILIIVFVFGGIGVSALVSGSKSGQMSMFFIVFMIAFYILLFAMIFGVYGYSIYMGIKAYKGEYVMYPIVGKRIYDKVYKVN